MKLVTKTLSLSLVATMLTGCLGSTQNMTTPGANTQKGAFIGAMAGAVLAGVTARKSDRKRKMLQGMVLGAGAGAAIGYNMDVQAEKMARALETQVDNSANAQTNPNSDIIVSKRANFVQITFRDAMMFATNSAMPTPSAQSKVSRVASILNQYPQTIVQVVGHTDNRGGYAYNQTLSKNRANNVANTLRSSGIPNQVFARGCAYNKPVVPNSSPANMSLNRRVEIYLYPNQQAVSNQCQ